MQRLVYTYVSIDCGETSHAGCRWSVCGTFWGAGPVAVAEGNYFSIYTLHKYTLHNVYIFFYLYSKPTT